MKSGVSGRRLAAGIFFLVLIFLSSVAFANVGRTLGTYGVSRTGAATYSIPIWAPRGPNGLEPHLTLVYNSQQASGYLGVGWSLAGVSAITRCNRTTAQDGTPAPVALTTADALCLDGERLQKTGGDYGVAGSTYQTEVANFEQVTAYGSAGNGPAYFIVQAPNGTQYEYGNDSNGAGSQVLAYGTATALTWYLDEVTDPAGNTMTFSYQSAGDGSAVPATVSWTPSSHGATTYEYTLQFAYGSNSAASSYYGYAGGTEVTNTQLLQSITVNYEGTTVKKYALTYQPSSTTGAEVLTQVEECADAAESNCLAPTTFGYQAPPVGTSSTATVAVSSGAAGGLVWNYDFNGDGRADLAYCTPYPSVPLEVAFASPSGGYDAPINTGIPCSHNVLYGDFLGTGQDGILAPNGSTWYYYQWNGSSFAGQSTGLAVDGAALQYVAADVEGDGRPDLIELSVPGSPMTITISVRHNTSSASSVSFSSTNAVWYSTTVPNGTVSVYAELQSGSDGQSGILETGNVKRLDFNGDGRDDLALEYQTISCIMFRGVCKDQYSDSSNELISTGSGFTETTIATQGTMTAPEVAFLNFNSDRCTDYLVASTIYVSGCNGTAPATVSVPSSSVVGIVDWNADGRGDVLVNNGGTIGVYESTGTGLSGLIATSIPYNSVDQYFGFDQAGDQLDALGAWEWQASPYEISYYSHNGAGVAPDLLTSITDGYGNTIKPAYVSLSSSTGSTYTPASDASFPYENDPDPLYVVSQVTLSDPSNPPNGTYQQTHYYSGALMNEQGRGFAGFETHSVYDSRNKLYERQNFNPIFPFTGMLTADTVTQGSASGQTVSSVSDTLLETTLDSTPGSERDFPYVSAAIEKWYEVGGTDNGDLVKTRSGSYGYDPYGNLTSATQVITDPSNSDSWTTTVSNTTDVSPSTWCLNLLTESQITYTPPSGSPSVTRTRDYTPDTTHCRYSAITTEPSSGSYEVIEALGYDDFGNIESDTITGVNMTARQSSANWGATGQFPMSVTDASEATTQFNYNFNYGLVSSETDPNGLTTSWVYGDGFGRITQETRPDGTYATYSYTACDSGNSYCGYPDLRLWLQIRNYGSDGSQLNSGAVYENAVDAIRFQEAETLSGAQTRIVTYYDALGRIVKKSMPFTPTATEYDTSYQYDVLNRLVQMQRPISQSDSTLQTTAFAYAGDTTTITDANGHTRTLIHDATGRLSEATDALGYSIFLGYDAAGSKTSVTDSLGNSLWSGTYAYGIAPFLVGESDMDRGTWGYTVDALGERTAWVDAKSQHFYATYDALSRPLTRTEPDLFTQWTWGSSAGSHNIGKLASVCTGTGSACSSSDYSEAETYDSLGRLSGRAITVPLMGTYTYTWQYSATTGLLDALTYPVSTSGKALTLQYAYQNGILKSITDTLDSPNVTVWQADAQNPAGQITQETLGNGLVTSRAYDAVTQWLSSVQSGPGGGASIQNQSFLYDEVGNVTQRQDNNLGLSEDFYYDDDNRLSYSTLNGTQNLSLNYDPMGNITSRSDVDAGATWTYDATHKHQVTKVGTETWGYTYDANGNMVSRTGHDINWTSYNYPSVINDLGIGEVVSFSYGPDRSAWFESTRSSSGTETAYHVGGLLDIVTSAGVTDYRHYIYAGAEPVAIDSRKSNGTNAFYYLLTDHQGSIAAITNSAGAVVVGESFTAYGSRRNPATWSGAPSTTDLTTIAGITRHGYTFQDALGTMGLNDMVGRVQDAITGRFLRPDPILQEPANPQDYNSYSYVVNNPLTFTDPTGFDCDFSDNGENFFNNGCTITARPFMCVGCFVNLGFPGLPPRRPGTPYHYPTPTHNPPPPNKTQCANGKLCNQQSNPCGGGSGPQVGPPSNGGNSNDDPSGDAGAAVGLTLSDIGLQAADRLTANVEAPSGVDLGAIGVVGKGVTALGLGMSLYQTFYGSTSQARAQGAQDSAVNGLGAVAPELAPFTSIPYDLGAIARELYDAWKNEQAAKLLDEAAQCTYGK